MKSKQELEKALFKITSEEIQSIQAMSEDIQNVADKAEISEDTIRALSNVINSLSALKEKYFWMLLRASKQNHMIS